MAAVGRGGHGRQGGRWRGRERERGGRAHGRGAPAVPAEPGQANHPIGFQWAFWKEGNANTSKKPNKDLELELKIYKDLEKNPKIDQDELHSYGVSAGLLEQNNNIVRMLHEVVEIYNRMAKKRRRFLYKKLHGVCSNEMLRMLKNVQIDAESAKSLLDDIKSANGYCPTTPVVFEELPKLK